jgi:hypothetical protein
VRPQQLPAGLAQWPPGPRLSALLASLDPRRLTAHQLAIVIAAQNRQISYEQSRLLLAVRELGFAPPKVRDAVVREGERNPFATVEAAFAASWTQARAEQTMQTATFTLDQVPDLGAALAAGRVDLEKVRVFQRMLRGVVDVELMRTLVAMALPGAQRCTTGALSARLRRLLAKHQPDAVRRQRERDHNDRFIMAQPDSAGLVTLVVRFCDEQAACAAIENIDAIARATKAAGDPLGRTLDQLRHDVSVNLLAGADMAKAGFATPADRRGTITLHVNLATLAGLTGLHGLSGACEHTTNAERAVLQSLWSRPQNPAIARVNPGLGGQRGASTATVTGGICAECLARLAEMASEPADLAGYGPMTAQIARQTAAQLAQVCAWRFAVADDDGSLLAEGAIPTELLPDMDVEVRRWAADATAGPDGRAHRTPSTAQIAFVRARDRHCQAPGCSIPAHRCQVDHRVPWSRGGPTLIDNLHCLCHRHHRAKDEADFTYRPVRGGLAWTTPAGHTYLKQRFDHAERQRRRRHHALGVTVAVDAARFHGGEPVKLPN